MGERQLFWTTVLSFLFVVFLIVFLDSLRKRDSGSQSFAVAMMALLSVMGILNFTVGLP